MVSERIGGQTGSVANFFCPKDQIVLFCITNSEYSIELTEVPDHFILDVEIKADRGRNKMEGLYCPAEHAPLAVRLGRIRQRGPM